MLDKLTYAGNRANLEGVEHEFHHGDIADPDAVARAARGLRRDRQLRRRDARRPLDPRPGGVHPHRRARHAGAARSRAARPAAARARLDRRGLRRRSARCARVHRRRTAPHVEPVLRRRRPAASFRCSRTCARSASTRSSHAEPTPTGRASTRRSSCRSSSPTRSTASSCRSTATASSAASGSTSRITATGSSSRCRRGRGGRGLQHQRRRSARTWTSSGASSSSPAPSPDLVRHVEDRAGPRSPLRRRLVQAARARLVARALVRHGRAGGDGRVVSREPRVVGADQVRRVPPLLRRAVRRPPRLSQRHRFFASWRRRLISGRCP